MATKSSKKLLTCKWLIACNSSTIDGDSNNISLLNIFDEIQLGVPESELGISGFKAAPYPLDIVVLWEREKDIEGPIELPFVVRYTDPKGAQLLELPGEVKMEAKHTRYRARFRLNAVPFTDEGEYKFQAVSKDSEKTGTTDLCSSSLHLKINKLT